MKSFKEEYLELLKKFEIEFDEKDLFEWIEQFDTYGIDVPMCNIFYKPDIPSG